MIVNSENIEFGYELISHIPYANYLASKGQLTKTISGNDTECLYFFSPKHEINPEPRSWYNTSKCNTPNIRIHKPYLDKSQFLAPDYKKQYANDRFKYQKELVIICNRHNVEWSTKPINFFDLPTLRKMFELLQDKYQVVYINIEGRKELYDNAPPETLGDFDLLKEYSKVINIHDLHSKNKELSFNTLQLMLFANCQKFITMNGGHALLAAYFGGENLIMSKYGNPQAKELSEAVNSFYRWYHEFSGQRCIHVANEEILIERINDMWIDCNPVVNILVRTSKRPNFFKHCINSILKQTYKNINIFVSIDDKENDYTIKYPVYPIFVDKIEPEVKKVHNESYGRLMIYNVYFNKMYDYIKDGLILYLDDDDKYNDNEALQKIVEEYKKGNELIFWRVKIGNKIIPENEYFGKAPVVFQINGTGFAFDSKYKNIALWEPWKRGDFRVASILHSKINNKSYINEVLTSAQDGAHHGLAIDISEEKLKNIEMETKILVKIINNKTKHGVLDLRIGDTIELTEAKARQYFAFGVAVPYIEDIEEPEIIEVISVTEPKQVVKRGRKSKK